MHLNVTGFTFQRGITGCFIIVANIGSKGTWFHIATFEQGEETAARRIWDDLKNGALIQGLQVQELPDQHPDPEDLALIAEGRGSELLPFTHSQAIDHLAICEECREAILAASQASITPA